MVTHPSATLRLVQQLPSLPLSPPFPIPSPSHPRQADQTSRGAYTFGPGANLPIRFPHQPRDGWPLGGADESGGAAEGAAEGGAGRDEVAPAVSPRLRGGYSTCLWVQPHGSEGKAVGQGVIWLVDALSEEPAVNGSTLRRGLESSSRVAPVEGGS